MTRYRGNVEAVRNLVRETEVHRDVYIDDEVFQLLPDLDRSASRGFMGDHRVGSVGLVLHQHLPIAIVHVAQHASGNFEPPSRGTVERTLMYNRLINAPTSVVGHDDLEMYERAQEGLRVDANQWVNVQRLYDPSERHDVMAVTNGTTDWQMRNQFRAWSKFMTLSM